MSEKIKSTGYNLKWVMYKHKANNSNPPDAYSAGDLPTVSR